MHISLCLQVKLPLNGGAGNLSDVSAPKEKLGLQADHFF
jgi:hypothetical protein